MLLKLRLNEKKKEEHSVEVYYGANLTQKENSFKLKIHNFCQGSIVAGSHFILKLCSLVRGCCFSNFHFWEIKKEIRTFVSPDHK